MEKNNILINDGLVGQLFEGEPHTENLPVIEEVGGPLSFKFVGDKCSFVLGSLAVVDFVVDAKGVAKEHVSFVMDINGVRIIPILQHKTMLDDNLVTQVQLLSHGAIITIADKKFIFKEQPDEPGALIKLEEPKATQRAEKPQADKLAKRGPHVGIKTFDAIFVILFISALLGTVFIYQN